MYHRLGRAPALPSIQRAEARLGSLWQMRIVLALRRVVDKPIFCSTNCSS